MPRSDPARLRSTGVVPDGPIKRGDPRYQYLLPEYPAITEWNGRRYRTIQHALLAASLEHESDRAAIAACATLPKAVRLHYAIYLRRPRVPWNSWDWLALKERLYRERFKNEHLRDHLKGTYPATFDLGDRWLDGLLTRLRLEYRLGMA